MGTQLFTNNADTTLASGITNVATTMTVNTGDGAKFPTITGSDFFYVTLFKLSGINEYNWEIVKVTARAGDVFTIVRAQDGTSASAFSTGDKVSLRMTAVGATAMAQKANNLSDLASAATARTNLGLGSAATQASTAFATAAQGAKADTALQAANNLSDVAVAATARTNLGLGTIATHPVADFLASTGGTLTGGITFSGTGLRIKADFSNVTIANRLAFQDATTNSNTTVGALPSGTNTLSAFLAFGGSDANNAPYFGLYHSGTAAELRTSKVGTGTTQPMIFTVDGAEKMRLDTGGNLGIGTNAPASFGPLAVIGQTAAAGVTGPFFGNNVAGTGTRVRVSLGPTSGFVGSPSVSPYIEAGAEDAANNSYIAFGTYNSGTGTAPERMRITSAGRVGINQAAPAATLAVWGESGGQTTPNITTTAGTLQGMIDVVDNQNVGGAGGGIVFSFSGGKFAAIKGYAIDGAGNSTGRLSISVRKATTDATLTETVRVSENLSVVHAGVLGQMTGEYDNGNGGAAVTINWDNGNFQKLTLNSASCAITMAAPTISGVYMLRLRIIQDATGGRAVTWATGVNWAGGVAPTIGPAANQVTVITLMVITGLGWYGSGLTF